MICQQQTPLAHFDPRHRAGFARACGMAGAFGVLVFLAVVVVLHVARRDISPVDGFVSDYANGGTGLLFTVAVFAHGAGNVGIAVGLAAELGPGRRACSGVVALGAASVGLLVAGMFRTDPTGASASVSGRVHSGAVSLSFLVELVALLIFASVFRADPGWRAYARPTLTLAILAGAVTLWMLVAVEESWAAGLAERAALAVLIAWEFSIACRLASRQRDFPST